MNTTIHLLRITIVLLLGVCAITGCSQTIAQGQTPTIPAPPTETATNTPAATATQSFDAVLSATNTPAASSTPTRRPATPLPRPTATPPIAPGIYVTAIKIDPTPVLSDQPPTFTVTFVNTLTQTQSYRWFVKIYLPDQPQSFGETSKETSDIVLKTSQVRSTSDWKTRELSQCNPMIARVFWIDQDNQVKEFLKPDGSNPATGFNLCPLPPQ